MAGDAILFDNTKIVIQIDTGNKTTANKQIKKPKTIESENIWYPFMNY